MEEDLPYSLGEQEEELWEEDEEELWEEDEELWYEEELWKEELWHEQNREQATPEQEEEKRRAGWKKPSEVKLLTKMMMLIKRKKMAELEEAYANKLALEKAGEEGVQAHNRLIAHLGKHFPDYLQFRYDWIARNPYIAFENITKIRAMIYSDGGVPRYVYNGRPNSLQIYSVKVVEETGQQGLQWPLHVFGLVAIRDSIDSQRNIIFNMIRDDCQALTKEDPCLILTGPSRAVVLNEESYPVTIEAELKVKSTTESEDKFLIFAAETVTSSSGSFELTGEHSKLEVTLGEIVSSVEATIFIRVTNGTWPVGFHGQFAASTASITKEIILTEFGGDNMPVSGDGNVEQSRHVVSVEASGELIVSFKAWQGNEEAMKGEVVFKAERVGRSFGTLKVGTCSLEVLVAWSRIRPMCEELVPMSELHLCHF